MHVSLYVCGACCPDDTFNVLIEVLPLYIGVGLRVLPLLLFHSSLPTAISFPLCFGKPFFHRNHRRSLDSFYFFDEFFHFLFFKSPFVFFCFCFCLFLFFFFCFFLFLCLLSGFGLESLCFFLRVRSSFASGVLVIML